MILKTKYKDLDHTLKALRQQIIDSLNYCHSKNFYFRSPREMYYFFLPQIQYKNDPAGIELLQTAQTLFENNYHNIPGAGDCDCFTCLVCAVAALNNWKQRIVLCGNTKKGAVHIFSQIYFDGNWQTCDLTARLFNTHKKYKYYQFLDI